MSPRRLKKRDVSRLVKNQVAEAIAEYKRNQTNPKNVGGSGQANVGGIIAPECLYKTFLNCKPHPFKGTKGVVRLTRWFKKIEQVFEIIECVQKKIKSSLLHALLKETRIRESNKKKWEDHQRNNNINNNDNHNFPPKCQRCQRSRHQEKDCRVRASGAGVNSLQNVTCYGCGEKEHFRNKCPKGRNMQNEGAHGRAYVMRTEDPQLNLNVVTGMFLLNDHYASILFDSGAEKSFMSTTFTPFIDIDHAALDTSYNVELADGKVDWLLNHRAVIVCYEKIVRILLSNGAIVKVQGKRPEKDLRSLSCIKSDEKVLKDIPIVRDFPKVFLNDLHGLPSIREVEFHIDIIPGALPVSKEEHEVHLKMMLELLRKEKLYAKFSKCEFWLQEVQFLGHVVNQDGIYVDPSKVDSVKNWKTPESPTQIRSFLGLMVCYRRFIKNFSKIAKPLTLLTYKYKKYEWGDKQEEASHILKEKLCNAPVLALLDEPNDFEANVVADALRRKERLKPKRVRAMSKTIHSILKTKILEAQGEASKDLKSPTGSLKGMDEQFERQDYSEVYY
nr:putative reverse transcriptase domain-containing protein [Tanacetum cinerariifolium]